MSKLLNFKGLMAPVFTAFHDDKNQSLNYEVIPAYAKFLKSKGISAVLVNGTSGEGTSMTTSERKKVTEVWSEICKKESILLMVQISGCGFADAIELANHAAGLNVDGVLCLPELYFKPKTSAKLVEYIKRIAKHCEKIPVYYYHIPMFTTVDVSMPEFMSQARKEIPNFAGIKFTSGDLEKGVACLKHGQVFLGADTILSGALALGFESAIMTSLNICPELSLQIVDAMTKGNLAEALATQNILNDKVAEILKLRNGEWVPCMKTAFNETFKNQMNMGQPRKPL